MRLSPTVPDAGGQRPGDLLGRDFTAPAPNRRWVADITYVDTACGFAYTAFVTDLFSRTIVGWQVADHLRAGLALDALEMAIFSRKDAVAAALNGRPRKTLGWKTPAEALDEFLYSYQQGSVATTT